jgi:hypothetical protein
MPYRSTALRCTALTLSAAVLTACALHTGDRTDADEPRPTADQAPATTATTTTATPTAVTGPTTAVPAAAAAGSADDAVNYVVAISVDGLNPDGLRRVGRSGAPAMWRMVDRGAATLNARSEYERTITLPNHTGMVTGRKVARPGGHGVTVNSDTGSTVHRTAGEYVASMFSVVHDRGGSTAFYSSKDKFGLLNRSWGSRYGAVDRVGRNNGRDKIDRYYLAGEGTNVTRLIRRLHNNPDELSFVHLAQTDRAGHAHGFMSARYLTAVRRADDQVDRILRAISNDRRLRAHTNVVLTADHGGRGKSHSDRTKAYNYTIPFLVWGVGVAKGRSLYGLNKNDRRNPGTRRLSYAGRQPVRNGEVANLVTDLLDMPRVPGSTFNTRQNLTIR